MQYVHSVALANAALCCLHTRQYEQGIQGVREAIDLMPTPTSPAELLARVQAEGTSFDCSCWLGGFERRRNE